jgi:regulatory protein
MSDPDDPDSPPRGAGRARRGRRGGAGGGGRGGRRRASAGPPPGPGTVTAIRSTSGLRVCVELEGERWLVVDPIVVSRHDLYAGRELDEVSRARVEAEADRQGAMERAGRLLGYRDRSHAELRRRLAGAGHAEEAVDEAVERLEDSGLVDDARFAERFCEAKVAAGWGRERIGHALRTEHRVDRATVREALDELCPVEGESARARALADRRHPPPRDRGAVERAARFLATRGFASGAVWAALGHADEADPPGDEGVGADDDVLNA